MTVAMTTHAVCRHQRACHAFADRVLAALRATRAAFDKRRGRGRVSSAFEQRPPARRCFDVRLLLLLLPSLAIAEPMPKVTKSFMRDIAAGKHAPVDLIYATKGIVEVVYVSGESEPPVTRFSRRLCGQKAIDEVAFIIRRELVVAVRIDELFSCKNRPRPSCVAGQIGEFATNREYVFHPDPDGRLVLDTIILTNSAYKPADESRVVARLQTKHAFGGCP
jgi:hypothetical protein